MILEIESIKYRTLSVSGSKEMLDTDRHKNTLCPQQWYTRTFNTMSTGAYLLVLRLSGPINMKIKGPFSRDFLLLPSEYLIGFNGAV